MELTASCVLASSDFGAAAARPAARRISVRYPLAAKAAALRRNLELAAVLGFMDVKLKYNGSFLGFLWSFIKPLSLFILYYAVFGVIFGGGRNPQYALKLFFGVIVWVLFVESTSLALTVFVCKKSIVSKIKLDNILLPAAAFAAPLVNFALSFCIFSAAYCVFHPAPLAALTGGNMALFAFSFLTLGLFTVTVNILLSNLYVLFRDLQPAWELALTYGVFLTPIMFELKIPPRYSFLYYCVNPLALPLQNLKAVFFKSGEALYADAPLMAAHTLLVAGLFCFSLLAHKKLNKIALDYL
ncbi:MAG: ABC transporter permease [Elusimicrobiales bacterium]|nr:ABC transporter permease [Elusimicrobiales bacterium]